MEIGNVILDPATAFPAAGAAALLGGFIWWLVRKRQTRVWLPTIRIMRLESRILPRLVLRVPPLLGFFCFVVAALVMVAFALRPRTAVFTPFEPNQARIHIFVDLSPSVSAHVKLEDYAQKVTALYSSLKEKGRVTVSTSESPEIKEPESADALVAMLKGAGFQRGGLRLGSAMKVLLEDLGEVDRLFVVADRDQHSWTGFNWRYLLDEMDVKFLDVAAGQERQNLFINDVHYLSAPGASGGAPTSIMDWEVEIARRPGGDGEAGEVKGKLLATYMGRTLGEFPWSLPAGKQRQNVRAEWPQSVVEEALAKEGAKAPSDEVPLVFRLVVEGGDALTLDDEFRTRLFGLRQDVLLVSETSGERVLEDPTEQLGTALEVLGFKLSRFDYIVQPGPAPEQYPFMVLAGGAGSGVDRFCPKSIEVARLAARAKQGARDGRDAPMPKIWLMPFAVEADYGELCDCYARLVVSRDGETGRQAYCEHVSSRQQWVDLLPSLGARQIGGELGNADSTLAWHQRDAASGLEVLAFSVPLTPLRATGINHAHLPILIKQLATWQGLIETGGGAADKAWPRLEDLAQKTWRPLAGVPLEPAELLSIRQSNVPLGESLLAEAEPASLPPRWSTQVDWSDQQLQSKKDREDPLPWLKRAALLVMAVTFLEGLVLLALKLGRFLLKRPEAATTLAFSLLAFTGLGLGAGPAEAKVEFSLVGYPVSDITTSVLAREVSHRTSIELSTRPSVYAALTPEALAEPWLFVANAREITAENGRLKPEVALWLKRGGFIVLESPLPGPELARLTEVLAAAGDGPAGASFSSGWMALPPDHELMRSFYLLDALPACNQEIWRGFHYDGRLAILAIPYPFLASIKDRADAPACAAPPDQERSVRIFVNLIMVALATDYKKDQIHLPEILKRLR